MSPPEALREALGASREAGAEFDTAWPAAVARALELAGARAEREQWRVALEATRDAWRASYEREPAERAHRAVASLVDLDERERVAA